MPTHRSHAPEEMPYTLAPALSKRVNSSRNLQACGGLHRAHHQNMPLIPLPFWEGEGPRALPLPPHFGSICHVRFIVAMPRLQQLTGSYWQELNADCQCPSAFTSLVQPGPPLPPPCFEPMCQVYLYGPIPITLMVLVMIQ